MPSPCQPQANRALQLLSVCLSCWAGDEDSQVLLGWGLVL